MRAGELQHQIDQHGEQPEGERTELTRVDLAHEQKSQIGEGKSQTLGTKVAQGEPQAREELEKISRDTHASHGCKHLRDIHMIPVERAGHRIVCAGVPGIAETGSEYGIFEEKSDAVAQHDRPRFVIRNPAALPDADGIEVHQFSACNKQTAEHGEETAEVHPSAPAHPLDGIGKQEAQQGRGAAQKAAARAQEYQRRVQEEHCQQMQRPFAGIVEGCGQRHHQHGGEVVAAGELPGDKETELIAADGGRSIFGHRKHSGHKPHQVQGLQEPGPAELLVPLRNAGTEQQIQQGQSESKPQNMIERCGCEIIRCRNAADSAQRQGQGNRQKTRQGGASAQAQRPAVNHQIGNERGNGENRPGQIGEEQIIRVIVTAQCRREAERRGDDGEQIGCCQQNHCQKGGIENHQYARGFQDGCHNRYQGAKQIKQMMKPNAVEINASGHADASFLRSAAGKSMDQYGKMPVQGGAERFRFTCGLRIGYRFRESRSPDRNQMPAQMDETGTDRRVPYGSAGRKLLLRSVRTKVSVPRIKPQIRLAPTKSAEIPVWFARIWNIIA